VAHIARRSNRKLEKNASKQRCSSCRQLFLTLHQLCCISCSLFCLLLLVVVSQRSVVLTSYIGFFFWISESSICWVLKSLSSASKHCSCFVVLNWHTARERERERETERERESVCVCVCLSWCSCLEEV